MKRALTAALLIPLAAVLMVAVPASADGGSGSYFTDFNSQQPELIYEVFQNGIHEPATACGTDACASFGIQGQKTYGKFTVNPSDNPGFYQNTATSQVAVGQSDTPADAGPLSVSYGHPITLEAKIKWSANYTATGGTARGTSGLILWNGAVTDTGQTPDYDQLGFTWASPNVAGGIFAGFTAGSVVDLNPTGINYPAAPLDIDSWFKVRMIWSQDSNGVQSVSYYADEQYLGTDVLPAQLHGLSLEIWNDNQEPVFCDEGLCNNFATLDAPQSFYVDYVKITQS